MWIPQPGPQSDAYFSQADILGYGGAAGGGKTGLLIGLTLEHQISVIYRRESSQLRDILEKAKEFIGDKGSLNENLGIWRNLPGKRLIEFGGVKDEKDISKWRGRAHDFIGFDEATEFTELQFRTLIAWNRSTNPNQRCRVVAAFNPPSTPEAQWVLKFWGPWLDPKHPNKAAFGELRYYTTIDHEDVELPNGNPIMVDGEAVIPLSRTFIPARLEDNAYLARTNYRRTLQALPEPLRSQLLYGKFNIEIAGDEWQVVPIEWIRISQQKWREARRSGGPLTHVGVDVARGGKDRTVIFKRYGNWIAPAETHPGSSTPDGAAAAAAVERSIGEQEDPQIGIDVIGIGASAYDHLKKTRPDTIPVNAAAASERTDRTGQLQFVNIRTEMYWALREALDPVNGDNILLPDDNDLLTELAAIHWSPKGKGLIAVEPKDDIKKRLGRSPDKADALAMAFIEPPDGVPIATGANAAERSDMLNAILKRIADGRAQKR